MNLDRKSFRTVPLWGLVSGFLVFSGWVFYKSLPPDAAKSLSLTKKPLVVTEPKSLPPKPSGTTSANAKPAPPAEKKPSETWERIFGDRPDALNGHKRSGGLNSGEALEVNRLLTAEFKRLVASNHRSDIVRLCNFYQFDCRRVFTFYKIYVKPDPQDHEQSTVVNQFVEDVNLVLDIFEILDVERVANESVEPLGNYSPEHPEIYPFAFYFDAWEGFVGPGSYSYRDQKQNVSLNEEQQQKLDVRIAGLEVRYLEAMRKCYQLSAEDGSQPTEK